MAFPKGLLAEGYLDLPEVDRTPLKKKYGIAKTNLFHRDFPRKRYDGLEFEAKNAMREQWWMTPLSGYAGRHKIAEAPTGDHHRAVNKSRGGAIHINEGAWPRTTQGAIAFIKAWNAEESGEAFMKKYNLDKPGWQACSGRAKTMRDKGVPLKEHKIEGSHIKYDWELLKQVAEGTMSVAA